MKYNRCLSHILDPLPTQTHENREHGLQSELQDHQCQWDDRHLGKRGIGGRSPFELRGICCGCVIMGLVKALMRYSADAHLFL